MSRCRACISISFWWLPLRWVPPTKAATPHSHVASLRLCGHPFNKVSVRTQKSDSTPCALNGDKGVDLRRHPVRYRACESDGLSDLHPIIEINADAGCTSSAHSSAVLSGTSSIYKSQTANTPVPTTQTWTTTQTWHTRHQHKGNTQHTTETQPPRQTTCRTQQLGKKSIMSNVTNACHAAAPASPSLFGGYPCVGCRQRRLRLRIRMSRPSDFVVIRSTKSLSELRRATALPALWTETKALTWDRRRHPVRYRACESDGLSDLHPIIEINADAGCTSSAHSSAVLSGTSSIYKSHTANTPVPTIQTWTTTQTWHTRHQHKGNTQHTTETRPPRQTTCRTQQLGKKSIMSNVTNACHAAAPASPSLFGGYPCVGCRQRRLRLRIRMSRPSDFVVIRSTKSLSELRRATALPALWTETKALTWDRRRHPVRYRACESDGLSDLHPIIEIMQNESN